MPGAIIKSCCIFIDLAPSVSDPGPDHDPDPEWQKRPTNLKKEKKFHVLKCWMYSFES
jgi:hypothetical protein